MRLAKKSVSPLPLYFKVMMEIRENILSGQWSSGSQLPGELVLAQHLGGRIRSARPSASWNKKAT